MINKRIILISVGILAAAILVIVLIFSTEPTAQSEGATKESAMLVSTVPAKKGNFTPNIVATGTVRPLNDVILSPLVNGQITRRSEKFVPGGFVKKGEVLLQIDPTDYQNNLELRKSELLQAKTDLEMEMGRQKIARQELQLIGGDTLSEEQKDLVLRQPQLNAIKARIQSAQAAVNQARTNLGRSTITAPFDAHIVNQNATVGSQVSPGDNLGRLTGTDFYWVNITVPVNKLRWLNFQQDSNGNGSMVKIMNETAWGEDAFREGFLDQQIGALDDQTRLARLLVKVPDPLATEKDSTNKPKMIIGSFVEANIQAKEIEDVVRLNRDFIRSNNTVWVMKDGKLEIREVKILLNDAQYAYITEGVNDGEEVVTSNISTVTEGAALRKENDSTATSNSEE
ncbi:MAG: efflux RND transporter periplasmic adaptor subunit [Bacteroidota bacterium]|nr:efflux RND transporter periplasmic adaptor subunit [Bacteroidota bacterium]